jgi:hypothetical protein
MSDTPPPQNIGFFDRITQQLLKWERDCREVLIPKQSELGACSGRIIQNAKRTFGYDKDDLADTFLNELTEYLASRKPKGLPEIYHRLLYDSALEEMELSHWNGAQQGAMSVFYPALYSNNQSPETPEKRFLTYYWSDKEIPFKKILEGLKNTQGSPLFNEETIRGAVNILCQYCQEQFVRGFSQGKGEAIWSPEKFRKAVASLIPDRTQG